MYADNAAQIVVKAGKALLSANLTARTWGNVSARIDAKSFAIKPSGLAYEAITTDDVVSVSINTLKCIGKHTPSSETFVHALLYKHYPRANFIIHTHQIFASVLSIHEKTINVNVAEYVRYLGHYIPVTTYALAGTNEIAEKVCNEAEKYSSKIVLMAKHGVVCFGASYEEVFKKVKILEVYCKEIIDKCLSTFFVPNFYLTDESFAPIANYTNDIWENKIYAETEKTDSDAFYSHLYQKIYNMHPDIKSIIISYEPYTRCLSELAKEGDLIESFLDDAAQILGEDTKVCTSFQNCDYILASLFGRSAVIIEKYGALCCGANLEEAEAVKLILEKNALAYLLSLKNTSMNPVPKSTAAVLRQSYINSYSKLQYSS